MELFEALHTTLLSRHLDDGVEDEGGAVPPLEQHRQVPRHGCGVQRLVARRGQCTDVGCYM